MTLRPRTWPLAVLTLATLVACGGPTPDSPDKAAPPAASRLPARPAELRLDGVDPCALLTDSQRGEIGLNPGKFKYEDISTHYPLCQWSTFPRYPLHHYLARLELHERADAALDAPDVQVVQIGGFSAVQASASGMDPTYHCILVIDVADGQSLWVQYNFPGTAPGQSHENACELARAAAEDMVGNLRALTR